MRVAVAFLPSLLPAAPGARGVCVAIDVLRATTTLTTLLERGAAGVVVAASAEEARRQKGREPGALLIGEIGGLRPADFDLGNSPREYAPELVAGRRAICSTSNGTAAIRAAIAAPVTLLGCVRNGAAVAARAYDGARAAGGAVTIACAGGGGGTHFALDDALVAGHLAALVAACAARDGVACELDEAAQAAIVLLRAEVGAEAHSAIAWEAALRRTSAGRHLAAISLGEDIPFCAAPDSTAVVPVARLVDEMVVLDGAVAGSGIATAAES